MPGPRGGTAGSHFRTALGVANGHASDADLRPVTRLTARCLGCSTAFVVVVGQRALALCGAVGPAELLSKARALLACPPFARLLTETGGSFLVEDVQEDARFSEKRLPGGAVSVAGCALRTSEGSLLGSLCVLDSGARRWSVAERADLAGFATLAARLVERADAAIEFRRAREELQSRVADLEGDARRRATILDNVYDSIIVTDLEGKITYSNPGATALFGYRAEELSGQTPALLYPDRERAGYEQDMARILAGEDYSGHWQGRRKDGEIVWVDVRTTVMSSAAGAPIGFIGVARDVTANKLAQDELNRERQLAAIVSHDLKGPIGVVATGVTALCRAGDLNSLQQRLLERIRSSAHRAARLTDQLLDFTSVRVGKGIALRRVSADIQRLVAEVVDESRMTHPSRRVDLFAEGEGVGEWDSDRVSEVVENLLTNALRYSPPETPVSVRTRSREREVLLEVQNFGPAIPAAQIARLFEPLEQGEQGRSKGEGLGLGLFIVDRIVRAHGGSVAVQSSETTGTTFSVTLPRARSPR